MKNLAIFIATIVILLVAYNYYLYGYYFPPLKLPPVEVTPPKEFIAAEVKDVQLKNATGKIIFDESHDEKHSIFADYTTFASFFKTAGYDVVTESEKLEKIEAKALVLVAPNEDFTQKERDAIVSAVRSGVDLLLIVDRGSQTVLNSLSINFDILFNDDYVYDQKQYSVNFRYPLISDFTNSTLVTNVSSIVIYDGCGLRVFGKAEPVAFGGENAASISLQYGGKIPVIATSKFGVGKIFAICDSELFTDKNIVTADNKLLAKNLVNFVTS